METSFAKKETKMNVNQKCALEAKKAYPGLYQEECCQQVVGGDTSALFSIGEATLVLCEQ